MDMFRFKAMVLGVPMLVIILVLSGCGGANNRAASGTGTLQASRYRVALVTNLGGLNDQGFNQLAHTGYEMAEQQYHFKDTVIQTASENDYVKNLTQAAMSNDLVIGVGFLMGQAIDQVAKQFPDKKFALVDGCAASDAKGDCDTSIKNVTPLLFNEQQAGCLVGVAAGQMELDGKNLAPKLLGANTIGVVGGDSIPLVDRYIAGYKFCAKMVDPQVKVIVSYSNDFTDAAQCQAVTDAMDKADTMIKQEKADIVFQVAGGCGTGALDAAETDGVYGIGGDTDQSYLHPDSIITSAVERVDTAVYTIIDLTEKGQYPSAPYSFPQFDLNNNGVGYAPLRSAVPADVQPVLNQYVSEIKAGTIKIPDSCAPAQTCASN